MKAGWKLVGENKTGRLRLFTKAANIEVSLKEAIK